MGQVIDTNPTDFELWVMYKHSWKTRGGTAGMPVTKSVAVSQPIKFQDSPQLRNTFFVGNLLYIYGTKKLCTVNTLCDLNNRVSITIIFLRCFHYSDSPICPSYGGSLCSSVYTIQQGRKRKFSKWC